MRNFDTFALSLEAREREIEIREKMNQVHRIAGYVSLAGMIGSGITGQMSSKGNEKAKDLHETFTGVTNFTYFGSLAFALFAPPRMKNHASGFTKTNIHRTLSIVHVTSMLATNILSGMLENNSSLVPYHRIAAITAFSSLFVATVVIKLYKKIHYGFSSNSLGCGHLPEFGRTFDFDNLVIDRPEGNKTQTKTTFTQKTKHYSLCIGSDTWRDHDIFLFFT